MRDAGDVQHRVFVFEGVETCVIAEWAFSAEFVQLDVAFQNNLGRRRYFQIDGLAFHKLNRFLPEKTGDDKLLDLWWRGDNGRKGQSWIGADCNRHFHGPAGRSPGGSTDPPPDLAMMSTAARLRALSSAAPGASAPRSISR